MTTFCFGQRGVTVNQGAKSYALGGIVSVLDGNDAILNNFSAVDHSTDLGLIVSAWNRFGLAELQSFSLGLHKKVGNMGHFGLKLSNYGFDAYSERTVSLLYAKQLSQKISISGDLGVYALDIEEYGSALKFNFKLGLSGKVTDDLNFGLLISNPEKVSIELETALVTAIDIGFRYKVSDKTHCYAEFSKELEDHLAIKLGIDYEIHPKFSLRTGYNTSEAQIGFGFLYKVSESLIIDAAAQYNTLFGVSPGLSIKFRKKPTQANEL